jgi:hypothetical protein
MPALSPSVFVLPLFVFALGSTIGGDIGAAFIAAVVVGIVYYRAVISEKPIRDLLASGYPLRQADYLSLIRSGFTDPSPPKGNDSTPISVQAVMAPPQPEAGSISEQADESERARNQVRQLVKQALDSPTPQGLFDFLTFGTKFQRMAVWNARMAYIQRPGARVIASEYEWSTVGRYVLPDAVPVIILWPFGPIRFVYELADTGPLIDRENFDDPFAVKGELKKGTLSKLEANLVKQKTFKIAIERRRQGFGLAGTAASQTKVPSAPAALSVSSDDDQIGAFAHQNASATRAGEVPSFRVVLNDALQPKEQFVTLAHELGHVFCGHLGGCNRPGREKDDESGWPDRRHLGKHQAEIEAEAVAYLVSSRAGLITHSAEYLRHHAERAIPLTIDEDLIVRAAARIERLAEIHHGSMAFKAGSPPAPVIVRA